MIICVRVHNVNCFYRIFMVYVHYSRTSNLLLLSTQLYVSPHLFKKIDTIF